MWPCMNIEEPVIADSRAHPQLRRPFLFRSHECARAIHNSVHHLVLVHVVVVVVAASSGDTAAAPATSGGGGGGAVWLLRVFFSCAFSSVC